MLRSESTQAALLGIDANLQLRFRTPEKTVEVSHADFIRYGHWRPAKRGPLILLTDGSVLRADVLQLSSEQLKLGDATGLGRVLWNETTLPLSQVRAICFEPPAGELDRDRLLKRLTGLQPQDQFWLASGETLAGHFLGLTSQPAGGMQMPHVTVQLQVVGAKDPIAVPLPKVVAISFNSTLSKPPTAEGARLALGFREGSLVYVRSTKANSPNLELQLTCGATLSVALETGNAEPPRNVWEQLDLVQAFGDHVIYLSDLKPVSFKAVPFLTVDWPFSQDASVLGGRLRKTGGEVALKGLGLHSAARLIYDVPNRASHFAAELAVDTRAGERGSVQFRVLTQAASGEWASPYESPIVRGGDAPLPISVPLKDSLRIALLVDFADRGDECDYANWLDARFVVSQ